MVDRSRKDSSIKSVFQKLANSLHESSFFLSLLLFVLASQALQLLTIEHILRLHYVVVVIARLVMVATGTVMVLDLQPVRRYLAGESFRIRFIGSARSDLVVSVGDLGSRHRVLRHGLPILSTVSTDLSWPPWRFTAEVPVDRMESGEIRRPR